MRVVQWIFDNPKTVLFSLLILLAAYFIYSAYSGFVERTSSLKDMFHLPNSK